MQGKRYTTSLVDRFYDNWTIINNGCWIWNGCKDKLGRGRLRRNQYGNNYILVSRVSYLLFYGPIPDDMYVCHKCDNPSCVNPEHLFIGTQKDNMTDKVNKNRQQKGEQCWNSRLTDEQVERVKDLVYSGMSMKTVSEIYNVSRQSVNHWIWGLDRYDRI